MIKMPTLLQPARPPYAAPFETMQVCSREWTVTGQEPGGYRCFVAEDGFAWGRGDAGGTSSPMQVHTPVASPPCGQPIKRRSPIIDGVPERSTRQRTSAIDAISR